MGIMHKTDESVGFYENIIVKDKVENLSKKK